MKPVLSRAQMRAFDAHAIEQCGVPSLVLMENAGRGAADVLVRELCTGDATGTTVTIVCGIGNNGGDGLVAARRLAVCGAKATVVVVGDPERASPDARTNLEAFRRIGGEVFELARAPFSVLTNALDMADVVVDALFGTGLDRAIEGELGTVVAAINASRAKRFALDVPSGLDSDTGASLGVAVNAMCTATFGFPKLGLMTPSGALRAGRVHVVDIGVPASLASHVGNSVQAMETGDVARWMTARSPGAYKGSAGHVLVLGGSPGKLGAPQLVARGALRAGAGLVTIAAGPVAAASIEARVLEVMTARIDPASVVESLDEVLKQKQVVVVGPGLGLDDDARAVVAHVLSVWSGPMVVDADALTLNAGKPSAFRQVTKAILTPHPGEAGRLLGRTTAEVEADRYRAARDLVGATGAVVVLKGAHTIVASPDSRVVVSPVSCPALATAGSGDVLSGIVAAMACSLSPFEAACAGVMLHALAGEAWSNAHGSADRGMLASEIAETLSALRFR
jgi:NAD(P)H-hydrate epimerase